MIRLEESRKLLTRLDEGMELIKRRASFLQAPTELSLAVVHFALQRDFDMNEVFQHLMSREGGQWKTQVRTKILPLLLAGYH